MVYFIYQNYYKFLIILPKNICIISRIKEKYSAKADIPERYYRRT